MKTTIQSFNLLSKTIKKRFGEKQFQEYFSKDPPEVLSDLMQENYLLLKYAPREADFLILPNYEFLHESNFWKFRGAFFCCTLPLLLKLLLLDTIVVQADSLGIEAFQNWIPFFRESYNRKFIDRRNLEWEAFLFLDTDFIQTFTNPKK
ncbi:hypothetical protein [Kordia sp.]|uniref:hypothetical protein n=1 Tax=Kordia sp. TaxID=1965332 RepID=UPI003D6AF9D2